MPSLNLLQRLSKFLHSSRTALVADCESVLQMENPAEGAKGSPTYWRTQLGRLIEEVATQLAARAAGEGWNVNGVISDEGEDHGAIQCLLLEASMVRNFFLRTLNRFQASQSGNSGFTAKDMTDVRQEALDIFDRITTASLSEWIRNLQDTPLNGTAPANAVAAPPTETPATPAPAEKPAKTRADTTGLIVQEMREAVRAASMQLGKLRAVVPSGRDGAALAALSHLQRMSALLETLGGSSGPAPAAFTAPEPVRFAPLAVRAFADALADAFRPLAEQKGLRFTNSVDPSLVTVDTDAPKLHRAASLLLANAIQYTVNGGVSLAARNAGGDWLLSVEDTGPGIEPDKLAHLLTGAAIGPDRVPHGLAVTRELIHLLSGHLDADSILRRGSRFTICLPKVHAKAK